jgi:hypothetical protein
LLVEIGERMQRSLDAWHVFLIAFRLSNEVQRRHKLLRYDDAVFARIHCLGDLVTATEALLTDVPGPDRHSSAVSAVKAAFGVVFPQLACPSLSERLADVLRPYWGAKDFWANTMLA